MRFLSLFKRTLKISEVDNKRRLSVALNERPLREVFYEEHFQAVLKAKEEWFQNKVELIRLSPPCENLARK